jgi:small GTP-binding protein
MNNEFEYDEPGRESGNGRWQSPMSGGSLFDHLRDLWQWDGLAAEIGQESQARVAFVGLPGVGKSLLFNRLRGWVISGKDGIAVSDAFELEANLRLESLGVFILADLPPQLPEMGLTYSDVLHSLGEPSLVVYLLDATTGVTAEDYRWVAALRATGKPLLAVLNKCDLVEGETAVTSEASEKLGMPVIPISAYTGQHVEEKLLPTMLDAVPRLAVPLGRELRGLRRHAARRLIRQAALLSGVVGAQPVPLLDLPFQVMIQVGVVMRVGAAYGYVPTGSLNREVVGTVVGTLGIRYAALALVKFIPFVGWAVAGALSGAMTFVIGEAAIRYYEAGATTPLRRLIVWPRDKLRHGPFGRGWLPSALRAGRARTTHHLRQTFRRKPKWVTAVPDPPEEIIEVIEQE